MNIQRKIRSQAYLDQILLWYDQPQVVLLKMDALRYVIAVAADAPDEDAYIGALISIRQLSGYQSERFDLRYVMTNPDLRKWYLFKLSDDGPIELRQVPGHSELVLRSTPEAGFFSRAHTPIKAVRTLAPSGTERFDIDGSWDLGEFSSFYGQVQDIYYIFSNVERFFDAQIDYAERDRIQKAVLRPFQGGGSYLGFYADIANDNDAASQLRVSGIQYNSPGFVEVKARSEPFAQMLELLDHYAGNMEEVRLAYRELYSFLAKNKLLKAKADTRLARDIDETVISLANALAESLKYVEFTQLRQIARDNTLVGAKLLLSFQRRVARMFKFFEQGRVTHPAVHLELA